MRIILRHNPDTPFFYSIDGVIAVGIGQREQIVDDSILTQEHKKLIKDAIKHQIIDVVYTGSTPIADTKTSAVPYGYHQLRKKILDNYFTQDELQDFLHQELASEKPRPTVVKLLERYANR